VIDDDGGSGSGFDNAEVEGTFTARDYRHTQKPSSRYLRLASSTLYSSNPPISLKYEYTWNNKSRKENKKSRKDSIFKTGDWMVRHIHA
jgi:hypothetical protein